MAFTGQVKTPRTDTERGSPFDLFSAPVTFSIENGKTTAELWDDGEPNVEQLRDMLCEDGTASQLESVLTLPVRNADWSLEPSKGVTDDVLQLCTDALTTAYADGGMQTSMDTVISQMTSSFIFRRSYHEKVFTRKGNQFVYSKIAFRPPDSCILLRDPSNGDIRGFKQQVPMQFESKYLSKDGYVEVPMQYAFVHVHNQHRDPVFGLSDFEVPYRCYQTKQKVLFLWATYLEVLGLPRTVVRGTTAGNALKAAKSIAALKSNGIAVIDDAWVKGIDHLPTGSGATGEFQAFIDYLDGQSADSMNAGFTRLSSRSTGAGQVAGALGKDASLFFLQLLQGFSKEMATDITNFLVADLVRYNFGSKAIVPKFAFASLSTENVQGQMAMLQALATAQSVNPDIPTAFVTDLVMTVAREFGFDLQDLQAAIDTQTAKNEQDAKTQQEMQLAQLFATTQVGAQVAQQGQQQMQGQQPVAQKPSQPQGGSQ